MFIQFTGTQSTGKTTTAIELRRFFEIAGKEVYFIGEISREFKKQGIVDKVDVEADSNSQLLLTNELLIQYLEKYSKASDNVVIIAERSPICCLAYSTHLINQTVLHPSIIRQTEKFIELTKVMKDIYTVYFPPKIAFKEDNIRNKDSREIIDFEIKSILFDFNIKYLELESDPVLLRVEKILEYINYPDYLYYLTEFALSIPDYNYSYKGN